MKSPWSKFEEETHDVEKNIKDPINEIMPDDYKTWYNRGTFQSKQQNYEDAVKSYDKALGIKPTIMKHGVIEGIHCECLENYVVLLKAMIRHLG